jgi:xanthine dehydrogenase YagT iron-sulfur-binding subunit
VRSFKAELDADLSEELEELEQYGLLTELSRRRFIQGSAALAASLAFGMPSPAEAQDTAHARSVTLAEAQDTAHARWVTLKVNGQSQTLSLDPRTSLLDALREHMELTGTKKGCDHGQCGVRVLEKPYVAPKTAKSQNEEPIRVGPMRNLGSGQ